MIFEEFLFRYEAASDIDLSNTDGEIVVEFMAYRKQLRNMLSAVGNFVRYFLSMLSVAQVTNKIKADLDT